MHLRWCVLFARHKGRIFHVIKWVFDPVVEVSINTWEKIDGVKKTERGSTIFAQH
jgi:hypothetical protein